ncbi:BQ5605_C001g00234 [Microbotryum silenes-dioicae]|uniref:BQ5605_C001g00234 protein n=1 Tax=Microbotryum silenes-dioicae TaxID=796604 RepID=A0A2X0MX61_9BASI|nr:BQ5605_C001g00234 [Microbotryum silenes-dioicae]
MSKFAGRLWLSFRGSSVSRTRAGISPSTLPQHWVSSALPAVAAPVFAAYLCHLLPRLDLPSDTNTLPPSLLPCQTTTDSCPLRTPLLLNLPYWITTLATQRASVQGWSPFITCVTLSKQSVLFLSSSRPPLKINTATRLVPRYLAALL